LRETDLIRKANKSLLRSIVHKEMDFGHCATKINTDGYGDNEDRSDDSEVQAEAVKSFFPTRLYLRSISDRNKMKKLLLVWQNSQSEIGDKFILFF